MKETKPRAAKAPPADQGARPPEEVTLTDMKRFVADIIDAASFQGKRFIITRHGKQRAAIVSLDDLRRLGAA